MKSIVKLLPIAALALMGCSSDDLNVGRSAESFLNDGDNMLVSVEELVDGSAIMRSAIGETTVEGKGIWRQFVWTLGDKFKVYDKDNWRTEIFKFNESANKGLSNSEIFTVFTLDAEKSEIATVNRGYAIFPAFTKDGGQPFAEFKDEARTQLQFELPATINAEIATIKENSGASYTANGETTNGVAYSCNAPMWGYSNDGQKMTFSYFTSIIRVSLQGIAVGTHTLKVTAGENEVLTGTFQADFSAGTYDFASVPTLTAVTSEDEVTGRNEITVNFEVTNNNKEAENILFVPVPAGEYSTLEVTLDDNVLSTPLEVTTLERAKFYKAGNMTPETETVSTLAELNAIIAKYADWSREVTVNVTLGSDIEVISGESTVPGFEYTGGKENLELIIPQLKNNVILNFVESDYDYSIKAASTGGATQLLVEDKEEVTTGTYALTLKGLATNLPVEVSTMQGFGLKGEFSQALTVTKAGALGLAGEFSEAVSVVEAGNVNLSGTYTNAVEVTKATNIELAGEYNGTVVVTEATDVTLSGTYNKQVTIGAQSVSKVTLSGTANEKMIVMNAANFEATETSKMTDANITASSAVKLAGATSKSAKIFANGSANVEISSAMTNANVVKQGTGNVEIKENAVVKQIAMMSSGTLTVNGNVTNVLSMYNGKLIVNSEIDCKQLSVVDDKSIEKTKVEIELHAGNFEKIVNESDANAEVTTYGAVTIKDIDDTTKGEGKTIITAYWTEATTTAAKTATKGTANDGNIYTALQLAALSKHDGTNVKLYADVKAGQDYNIEWTPLAIFESNATTFDGNGKTISGLKIKKNGNNVGFFTKFSGDNVTVKDLTLDNVEIAVVGPTGNSTYFNIGGLVGYAAATVTSIENVKVTNGKMNVTNWVYRVGGLIGTVTGKAEIKNTSVSYEKITGWYELGGLIGSVGNSAKGEVTLIVDDKFEGKVVTLTDESGFALSYNVPATALNNGRIGMLVGAMGDNAASTFKTEGVTTENVYNADRLSSETVRETLGFKKNMVTVETGNGGVIVDKYYTGHTGHYVGYSNTYSNSGNVNVCGKAYTTDDTGDGLNIYVGKARQ